MTNYQLYAIIPIEREKESKTLKIIKLDELNRTAECLENWKRWLAEEEAHTARCKSAASIAKAEKKIANYKDRIAHEAANLAELNKEKSEALSLAADGNAEFVFAYYWTDDYGRKDSAVERQRFSSYEDALYVYNKAKEGNGSYIHGWIEVRSNGEAERIAELKKQIAELKAELKALENGD